jgi:hypothetical protein
MMTRRDALKTVALAAGALTFGTTLVRAQYTSSAKLVYPFKVPPLGYSYTRWSRTSMRLRCKFITTNTTAHRSKILIRHSRMLIQRFSRCR